MHNSEKEDFNYNRHQPATQSVFTVWTTSRAGTIFLRNPQTNFRIVFKVFNRRKLLKVLNSCYKKSDEATLVQNFLLNLNSWTKIYLEQASPPEVSQRGMVTSNKVFFAQRYLILLNFLSSKSFMLRGQQ